MAGVPTSPRGRQTSQGGRPELLRTDIPGPTSCERRRRDKENPGELQAVASHHGERRRHQHHWQRVQTVTAFQRPAHQSLGRRTWCTSREDSHKTSQTATTDGTLSTGRSHEAMRTVRQQPPSKEQRGSAPFFFPAIRGEQCRQCRQGVHPYDCTVPPRSSQQKTMRGDT